MDDSNHGRPVPRIGAFSFIDSPTVVEALADTGFDWLCLDQQHGRHNDESVLNSIRACGMSSTTLFVRVRSLDAGLIGRALDAGAQGLIVPMVQNATEAAELTSYALYPPAGRRSWGPIRSSYGSGTGGAVEINRRLEIAAMVETAEALDQAEAIAAVPGITMLFVGPFDLSLALGTDVDSLLADESPSAPLARIAAAASAAGITAGAFAGTPERAARLIELGYGFVASSSDTACLTAGATIGLKLA